MSSLSEEPNATAGAASEALAPASFHIRTLIAIAERRAGFDSLSCRLALLHIETATLLQRSLHRTLALQQLTDVQFAILVVLFATEPEPIAVSVLAEHAGLSPSSVGDALEKLEVLKLVRRIRDNFDRRVSYARITSTGQETVDAALSDYLHVAEELARHIRPSAQRAMLSGYIDLLRALARREQPRTGFQP